MLVIIGFSSSMVELFNFRKLDYVRLLDYVTNWS